MVENQTIKERLILFIKHLNMGQRKFEETCGLANGYVNNIRRSVSPDKLQKIAQRFPDLNTGWLMTGEGQMMRPTVNQQTGDIYGNAEDVNVYNNESDAFSAIMKVVESNQKNAQNYIEIVKKSQEQIDRLIALLEAKS